MKRCLPPLVLLVLLGVFAACSNVSKIIATGLDVEITGIERTADHTAEVSWRLKNPNVVSYLLARVTLKVRLNNVALGTINHSSPLALPANHNVDRTGTLAGLSGDAARALADAVAAGSTNYHVDTEIIVQIYDEDTEKSVLTNSGTVSVKAK